MEESEGIDVRYGWFPRERMKARQAFRQRGTREIRGSYAPRPVKAEAVKVEALGAIPYNLISPVFVFVDAIWPCLSLVGFRKNGCNLG
jgi:hypothetical protein